MKAYYAAFMPEGGQYTVFFPDLPGCHTAGDTLEEALGQAADALAGHLEARAGLGYPIPDPTDLGTAKAKLAGQMESLGEAVPDGTVMELVPAPGPAVPFTRLAAPFADGARPAAMPS